MKRIVSIQDISALGKCSLTVALPIISAMGVECAVVPTAVLSTHTQFSGFTFCDLTDEMEPIADHWKQQDFHFDAIYTGYLGSFRQVDIVKRYFRDFGDGAKIIVDPAMADNGELYPTFDEEFPVHMRKLCSRADILKPNLTEACLLVGIDYKEGPYTKDWIIWLLRELSALGPNKIVLTGVYFDDTELGAAIYDKTTDEAEFILRGAIPGIYYGTGDISVRSSWVP